MKNFIKNYLLTFLYILLINIVFSSAVIPLHEIGHLIGGYLSGCKNIKIIFFDSQNMGTYTQMNCEKVVNEKLIAAIPVILVTLLAFPFFLLKPPEKFYGIIIVGLNLVISVSDMQSISPLIPLSSLQFIAGICLIVWGEILIINYSLGKIKIKGISEKSNLNSK